MPSSIQNLFTTDAVAMLCGVGEYKMRVFIGKFRADLPPPRFVPAWMVGNHKGYNKQRVFTAEDVVAIRAVVEREKAAKRARWQARMVRRRLRWAGKGVEPARWQSRQGPLGPPAPKPDGSDAA
jgi:hypothetical protein